MGVTLHIHKTHRQYTGGKEKIEVEGQTVGQCLDAMVDNYPEMADVLFSAPGRISNQVEIYLNAESAYPDELKKAVNPGDQIYITVMLMGG